MGWGDLLVSGLPVLNHGSLLEILMSLQGTMKNVVVRKDLKSPSTFSRYYLCLWICQFLLSREPIIMDGTAGKW